MKSQVAHVSQGFAMMSLLFAWGQQAEVVVASDGFETISLADFSGFESLVDFSGTSFRNAQSYQANGVSISTTRYLTADTRFGSQFGNIDGASQGTSVLTSGLNAPYDFSFAEPVNRFGILLSSSSGTWRVTAFGDDDLALGSMETGLPSNFAASFAGVASQRNIARVELVKLTGAFAFLFDDVRFEGGDIPDRTTLIQQGDIWKYLDDGTNQGDGWRSPGFDDDLWAGGPAQLGYGDGDEATVVNCGPSLDCRSGNLATTYFRHTFDVENRSLVESLNAWILRDDAAAVYLNGEEIFRDDNLPSGATYNTFATATGSENGTASFTIDPSLLVDGENTLAVEVHQLSPNSSDISFDFRLAAVMVPIPEPTTLTLTALGLFGLVARSRRRRVR